MGIKRRKKMDQTPRVSHIPKKLKRKGSPPTPEESRAKRSKDLRRCPAAILNQPVISQRRFPMENEANIPEQGVDSFFLAAFNTNKLKDIPSGKNLEETIDKFLEENFKEISCFFSGIKSIRASIQRNSSPLDMVILATIFDVGIEVWEQHPDETRRVYSMQNTNDTSKVLSLMYNRNIRQFTPMETNNQPEFSKVKNKLNDNDIKIFTKKMDHLISSNTGLFPTWGGNFIWPKDFSMECIHGEYIDPFKEEIYKFEDIQDYLLNKNKSVTKGYSHSCVSRMVDFIQEELESPTQSSMVVRDGNKLRLIFAQGSMISKEEQSKFTKEFGANFRVKLKSKKRVFRSRILAGNLQLYKMDLCHVCGRRIRLFHRKKDGFFYAIPFKQELPSILQACKLGFLRKGQRPTQADMRINIEQVMQFSWTSIDEDIQKGLELPLSGFEQSLIKSPLLTTFPRELFILDLLQLPVAIARATGCTHLLIFVDVYSKYAYSKVFSLKAAKNFFDAARATLSNEKLPKNIMTHCGSFFNDPTWKPVSYTHLRAHETGRNLVCRLLLEKKK
eukprot:TRINITY_DN12858_c0_g2_i1.p1 TRINITY_DN12858_c0_g2~~TRINITY_DN12858_c0_g2_i1.p1  ORF type:complete len:559 (-),score=62.29 TRINITY_DN12858_c0_g2_i1:18-1694(-)